MLRQILHELDSAGNEFDHPLLARAWPHIAVLVVTGCASYFAVIPTLATEDHRDVILAIFGALLAFAGLIIGFVSNLMLFTGKLESSSLLSLEELKAYAERLRALLHSQALTLVSSSILAALCIISMISCCVGLPVSSRAAIIALTVAYGVHSGLRALILPLQIFELHDAWLSDLVEKRAESIRNDYASRNKEGSGAGKGK